MQKIITQTDLRVAILQLESKQELEGILLKEQFLVAYESVKPINLIKSTFLEAAGSGDLQDNLINSSIGMSAGFISKMLFQGISGSPVKKIIGTALMFGIKNLVAHNPETVKSWGKVFFTAVKSLFSEHAQNSHSGETPEPDDH
jgi:hypothetical protein